MEEQVGPAPLTCNALSCGPSRLQCAFMWPMMQNDATILAHPDGTV